MAVDPERLVRGIVALVTGLLYVAVARVVLRRSLRDDAALASRLFATWWIGLAIVYLASGPYNIALAFGYQDLAFTIAFIDAVLIVFCIALWGILGFLLYVYTGTHRLLWVIGSLYGLLAFGMLWLVAWMDPTGFKPGSPGTLEFSRELATGGSVILGLLFSVPIFTAAVAYLTLLFRTQERAPRYRIAMVGGAFALNFGWSILSAALGLSRRFPDSRTLIVINQALALLVPTLILVAYRPPRWIARRLGDATVGQA